MCKKFCKCKGDNKLQSLISNLFIPNKRVFQILINYISPNQPNFDREEEIIEDNKRGEDIRESLKDDKEMQLEIEKRIFEPK